MIRGNQIKNCKATPDHVEIAHGIWGKIKDYLKGRRVRSKTKHVDGFMLKVPTEYLKLGKKVYLTCDVFFVNKVRFFITLSRKIDFTGTAHLKDRKIKKIFLAFLAVYKFYLRRGFRIKMVHADNDFGPMRPIINKLKKRPAINLAAANEHIPEIERGIRLLKERTRTVRSSLPFNKAPSVMIIYLVLSVSKFLTYFITNGGISKTMNPRAIMCGEWIDQEKHLCLQFGEYCQVYE